MITVISLGSIFFRKQLPKIFFPVMKTFKIYSLINFQIYTTILLTIVTMLYITSPGPIYFITGSLYLLTIFTHFTRPPHPFSVNHQSVLCIYELIFTCLFALFLDSTCKRDRTVFVFFYLTYFTQHNALKPIHVVANGKISLFFMVE